MAYVSAVNDVLDGVGGNTPAHAAAYHDIMEEKSVGGLSQLAALMAKFDEPLPAQAPVINHAQIDSDLANDRAHYEQAASAMQGYWGVPVAPTKTAAPAPTKALDSVADFVGGAMDSFAQSATGGVSTSRLSGYMNQLAQKPEDLAATTSNTPTYRNNKPTLS